MTARPALLPPARVPKVLSGAAKSRDQGGLKSQVSPRVMPLCFLILEAGHCPLAMGTYSLRALGGFPPRGLGPGGYGS